MSRFILLAVFLGFTLFVWAQEHPLSKSDSGVVIKNLEKFEYLSENKDWRGASEALNQVAFVYWNNNHYSSAADYYERSLELNKRVANENGIAMLNNNLGMLYADLGLYERSLECFRKTFASRKSNQEKVGIISASINMSVVLNNLERYDESVEYLLEALGISREMYDEEQMRSVYGMLSETYEKIGDVDKSLQYFELYRSFHEEINRRKITEINQELESERVEKELLEAQRARQENEMLKKQLELYQAINEQDSLNKTLYSKLSKREMELELVERDKMVAEMRANEEAEQKDKLKVEKKFLTIIIILIVLFFLVLTVVIIRYSRRMTKYNEKLKVRNAEIADQKVELLTANKTKDRIFSVISHDLRSPIGSMRGFFQYIDEFDVTEELKQALGSIESQLSNSATLLDNLLVWSRSQLNNSDPRLEDFEVFEVADQSLRLLEPLASKKGVQLHNNVGQDEVIHSDERFVDITLRNLLQNAIKFTPKGGEVSVDLVKEGPDPILKVIDSGVGMSKEKLKTLFDIATNKSTDGTNSEKGSGLGLVLCKELIEKVGGSIEVSSEPGTGTEFSLRF